MARDTKSAIEPAGFEIETSEHFRFSFVPFLPPDPHILETARRSDRSWETQAGTVAQ